MLNPWKARLVAAAVALLLAGQVPAHDHEKDGHRKGHQGGHHQGMHGDKARGKHGAHGRLVEGAPTVAPGLALGLARASDGGYHLTLDTERFTFSKAHADGAHVYGEGHAHLYIDGVKIGRIYEHSTRIEPLSPGTHSIEVGLFTNDHGHYAVDGRPVWDRFVVLQGRHPRPTAPAALHRIAVPVSQGAVAQGQRVVRVSQGDTVQLRLTSDQPLALHLHGYDIEARIDPHSAVTLHFLAHAAGRFPVAAHGAEGGGHGHHAALFHLEVHPR